MIPQSFIHDVLNRTEIVDVIDSHVALKKAGVNYSACCPFHKEKTPSFTVSPVKQFYHCFGCKAHGNAIGFLMEYSGMSFVDAVADLATRVGMQVPIQQADNHPAETEFGPPNYPPEIDYESNNSISSNDLFEIMMRATKFYRVQLKQSEQAINYLKKRGLTGETASHFALGYAPDGWQNLEAIFPDYQSTASENTLLKTGLIVASDDGKYYDRFRDRIMFPILNQKGMVVGFGGRVLGQSEPKYLNSPETILFTKGRELYNLFAARRAIRQAGCVLVVEGYMDVVALYQHGIEYTVASLGTATTPDHIQKLLRQTDNIIFCFDGDNAGRKAAWRAMENSLPFLTDGKNLSFLFLPDGEDPDSYVSANGKEDFEALLKHHAVALSIFLFQTLSTNLDLQTSEGRAKLVRDAKPLLKHVTAPILGLMLLQRLAELSGVSQDELQNLLQIKRTTPIKKHPKLARPKPTTPYHWLIQILLYKPGYINQLTEFIITENGEASEEIATLNVLIDFLNNHPHITDGGAISTVSTYFNDSQHRELLEKIESETLEWDDAIDLESEFSGALAKIKEIQRKKRMTTLHNKSLNILTNEEKQELKQLSMPK